MGHTRGVKFANLERFVTERHGAQAFKQILAALPAHESRALREIDPAAWYDLSMHAALTRAACILFGEAAFARDLGRFEADSEAQRPLRWLLKIVPPSFAIRNLNVHWRRAQDTGRWSTDVDASSVRAVLRGWETCEPLLCQRTLGFLSRALEHMGLDLREVAHPECRADGHEACLFEARWEAPRAASRRPPPLAGADVAALALELASYPDRAVLEVAILHIFREQLGFSRVALWLGEGDDLRLVRAMGEGAGEVSRRYILQSCGRVLGRIDLAATAHVARRAAPMVHKLLPSLAIALDRCPEVPPRCDDAAESPAARRARALRDALGLTVRQAEVLQRIAEGQTNKEVARDLGCTESAVEQHITHILRRASAPNRATLLKRFWSGS